MRAGVPLKAGKAVLIAGAVGLSFWVSGQSGPTIVVPPGSHSAVLNGSTRFVVEAAGEGWLAYQWQKNGVKLTDDGRITGARTATLNISDVQLEDFGVYAVLVNNGFGTGMSPAAVLSRGVIAGWGEGAELICPFATNVVALSAGEGHSLALQADGKVLAWGWDFWEQASGPASATNVLAVAAGAYHSLVLHADRTVEAWGYNEEGQASVPPEACNVVAIAAGTCHSLALRGDGSVVGWGNGGCGATVAPAGATNVVAIAAGAAHSLALRADGKVVAWGWNSCGQANVPVEATNVVAIAAGEAHSLALRADGTVVAWGDSTAGQATVPDEVSNIIAIAAGGAHNLALRSDSTVLAWGSSSSGQTQVPANTANVVALAAGGAQSLTLVRDTALPLTPAIPVPPEIWQQPSGKMARRGETISLNAGVWGALPMAFQWSYDGAPLPGQTNQWLMLADIQPGSGGDYQLVASNLFGVATSALALVTVSAPAVQLAGIGVFSKQFRFSFNSLANVVYVSEWSSELESGGRWTELERRAGRGGVEVVTDPRPVSGSRFYRVWGVYALSPPYAAPRLEWSGNNGAERVLWFLTEPGAEYVLESTERLDHPVWVEVSRCLGTGTLGAITDARPLDSTLFYRVVVR